VRSLWNDVDAAAFTGDLQQRVYSARLLGHDPALVLHGGGNTSVKVVGQTLWGDDEELLHVKGSGRDLASIDEQGFSPVRLATLRRLAQLERLTDLEMARELRVATIDPAAPAPSVEAILHGIIPHRFVDHTHADAVIAVTNTPSGAQHAAQAFGAAALVLPYVMPGFDLAKQVSRLIEELSGEAVTGLVLLGHGAVTFGATARESYERMVALVTLAEDYLRAHEAWDVPAPVLAEGSPAAHEVVRLRAAISELAGRPLLVHREASPAGSSFAARADLESLASRGPATPDHAIRTKRIPLVGRDVAAYAAAYREYFDRHAAEGVRMLDPAPRVILDPELGLCTAGATAAESRVAAELYLHTIEIIERAEELEAWAPLPEADIFAVEYWDLEQAKLARDRARPVFQGEVAVVTGAASGIGRACVAELLASGAAVCGLDLDERVTEVAAGASYLGQRCDVTSVADLAGSLDTLALEFGGLDMLVLSAGVFPPSCRVEAIDLAVWRRVFAVNLDANVELLRLAHPWLAQAPRGGRVVVVGSKNVPAPGPGAAAYSASKAALTQLGRISALEWGADRIRVNVVHPNAVFDTGIWSDAVIAQRASEYGISVEEYRRQNVLRTEIVSADVARLVAAMCGDAFAKTTGAQVPIDGGNERVI
jgi:rhamnose utilization protein RhaD (predicted bifunctional aldolase and dehydrogenase)/NAD(P)-dependent dehydrogenase (short-subunit alcohol dehydrogenase family)